ncbi:hypothetical protein F5X96DRAFT_665473 [Biscogniauxia mediterranea]|nr:hypothetical protein F5X96DRAFT_665473 [Biscogniauxia mediterranea]
MGITYERLSRAGFQEMLDAGYTRKEVISRIYETAQVVANAHWGTATNQALLQPWVNHPENEEHRKSLEAASVREWDTTLRWMLLNGACIHTALLDERAVVGAVVVLKLDAQLGSDHHHHRPVPKKEEEVVAEKESPRPVRGGPGGSTESDWLRQLHAWAWSGVRTSNLYRSVGANRDAHMRAYHPNLWQISSLAVAEGHRKQGVGTELLSRALSDVPAGGAAYLIAEPGATKLYEGLGFALSELEGHRYVRLEVLLHDGEQQQQQQQQPEIIDIPSMVLKKQKKKDKAKRKRPAEVEDSIEEVRGKPEPRKRRKVQAKN